MRGGRRLRQPRRLLGAFKLARRLLTQARPNSHLQLCLRMPS